MLHLNTGIRMLILITRNILSVSTYSRNTMANYPEIGLVINNLFNTKWKETQFVTETRLRNEPLPVDEICFTAGTPFAAKISFTYFFR